MTSASGSCNIPQGCKKCLCQNYIAEEYLDGIKSYKHAFIKEKTKDTMAALVGRYKDALV